MTTEEDFQAALDEHPGDHHTRLVFADWLEEQGDPRADGYRALGMLKRLPFSKNGQQWVWFSSGEFTYPQRLPDEWIMCFNEVKHLLTTPWRLRFSSRQLADDVASLAFCHLTRDVRREVLKRVL